MGQRLLGRHIGEFCTGVVTGLGSRGVRRHATSTKRRLSDHRLPSTAVAAESHRQARLVWLGEPRALRAPLRVRMPAGRSSALPDTWGPLIARKTEILVLSLLDARRGVGPFPSISPINWARSPIIKYQQVGIRNLGYRRRDRELDTCPSRYHQKLLGIIPIWRYWYFGCDTESIP